MAPRILIFSIAIGADYSYEVQNSDVYAPAFFKHNISFIATVVIFQFNFQSFFNYSFLIAVWFWKSSNFFSQVIECPLIFDDAQIVKTNNCNTYLNVCNTFLSKK